jgi:hypothetical protein
MALGFEISLQEQEAAFMEQEQEALLQALSELATDETLIRFLEEHQEEHQGSQKTGSPLPPFKWGWYSHWLSIYLHPTPGRDSYESHFFDYESLPPLPGERFNGTFQWLPSLESDRREQKVQSPVGDQREQRWNALEEALADLWIPGDDDSLEERRRNALEKRDAYVETLADMWGDDDSLEARREREVEEYLPPLILQAQELGLTLPEAFVTFMSSAQLRHRIPTGSTYYFELPGWIRSYSQQGYLIDFLSDQQGCVTWCLYLSVQGDHCILVTTSDDLYSDDFEVDAAMRICAASFEEFLYRFWIESIIWKDLWKNLPPPWPPGGLTLLSEEQRHDLFHTFLSEEQRRYLLHYLL